MKKVEQVQKDHLMEIYDEKSQHWVICSPNLLFEDRTAKRKLEQFTTITFNVLFDKRIAKRNPTFVEKYHIKHSEIRFQHIVKEITEKFPEFVTLNEVTPCFLQILKKNRRIQKHYGLTLCQFNLKTGSDIEGNLIIFKNDIPIERIQKLHLNHYEAVPIIYLSLGNKKIALASVHLIAFKGNVKERKQQLGEIRAFVGEKGIDCALLQGDMNFHSEEENEILKELQLADIWLQKYNLEENPGYTFDSQLNTMIQELYWDYEQRRMRLDRIFTFNNDKSETLNVKEIKIILNQPIHENGNADNKFVGRSTLSFIGDVLGKNWFRNENNYLFPSDHFGLEAIIQIS